MIDLKRIEILKNINSNKETKCEIGVGVLTALLASGANLFLSNTMANLSNIGLNANVAVVTIVFAMLGFFSGALVTKSYYNHKKHIKYQPKTLIKQ